MMSGGGYGSNYGGMLGGGWFGGALMLFFGALVVVGIVLLVIWAVRGSHGHGSEPVAGPVSPAGHDEALAIARRRLATGEITKVEYDEIMKALGM